jgi:hypothetical protein
MHQVYDETVPFVRLGSVIQQVLRDSLQYPQSSTNYSSLKYGTDQIHKIIYSERTQMMGKN